MKYGIVFLLLGLACIYHAWEQQNLYLRLLLGSGGICFGGVGVGFLYLGPRVFLKHADGRLSFLSYLLYWPYHALNWVGMQMVHHAGKENAMDEILPRLYLGRRLVAPNTSIEDQPFAAVLDLTSEFSRSSHLSSASHYKCIPLLDTFAPTTGQLDEGVGFLAQHINEGPVYVHCAMGHGRSATFVAAYLIAIGQAHDVAAAERLIQAKRPLVSLHPGQIKALENFMRTAHHD